MAKRRPISVWVTGPFYVSDRGVNPLHVPERVHSLLLTCGWAYPLGVTRRQFYRACPWGYFRHWSAYADLLVPKAEACLVTKESADAVPECRRAAAAGRPIYLGLGSLAEEHNPDWGWPNRNTEA